MHAPFFITFSMSLLNMPPLYDLIARRVVSKHLDRYSNTGQKVINSVVIGFQLFWTWVWVRLGHFFSVVDHLFFCLYKRNLQTCSHQSFGFSPFTESLSLLLVYCSFIYSPNGSAPGDSAGDRIANIAKHTLPRGGLHVLGRDRHATTY